VATDTGGVQCYDRRALVFDGADSALGAVALGLVARGIDPVYANEDELVLLARAVSVEFPIGERMLSVSAVVAHRSDRARPSPQRGPGMGVAFSGLAPLEARLVEGFVRERVDSFRL